MQDLWDVKKDFEIFGKGIQRLEEIKKELKSLNTKGHEEEVKAIEQNLNNVSAIPKIENQLEELKTKISGKSIKPAEIRARPITIEKQISELKDLVTSKHRLVAKSLSKSELEDIHEIPKIDASINEIKGALQAISNRKNQVSKKYLDHISEIPKIEQHIEELKSEIEKRAKRIPSGKIDSGAGSVVQKYFNDMLLNIKYEFSNILKSKKKELEDKINLELKRKEKELEEKLKLEREKEGSIKEKYANHYANLEKSLKEEFKHREAKLKGSHSIALKNKEKVYEKKLEKLNSIYNLKLKMKKGELKAQFENEYEQRLVEKGNKLKKGIELQLDSKYKKRYEEQENQLKSSFDKKLKEKENEMKKIANHELLLKKKQLEDQLKKGLTNILKTD